MLLKIRCGSCWFLCSSRGKMAWDKCFCLFIVKVMFTVILYVIKSWLQLFEIFPIVLVAQSLDFLILVDDFVPPFLRKWRPSKMNSFQLSLLPKFLSSLESLPWENQPPSFYLLPSSYWTLLPTDLLSLSYLKFISWAYPRTSFYHQTRIICIFPSSAPHTHSRFNSVIYGVSPLLPFPCCLQVKSTAFGFSFGAQLLSKTFFPLWQLTFHLGSALAILGLSFFFCDSKIK